jgi:hypothetical protein
MWHNPVRITVRVPHKGARTPIRSVDNLMALAICPTCHTPISVASGQCDVVEKGEVWSLPVVICHAMCWRAVIDAVPCTLSSGDPADAFSVRFLLSG